MFWFSLILPYFRAEMLKTSFWSLSREFEIIYTTLLHFRLTSMFTNLIFSITEFLFVYIIIKKNRNGTNFFTFSFFCDRIHKYGTICVKIVSKHLHYEWIPRIIIICLCDEYFCCYFKEIGNLSINFYSLFVIKITNMLI